MTTAKSLPARVTAETRFLAPETCQRAAGFEAANDGADAADAAMVMKERVFEAKRILQARRRAHWSYWGPEAYEPMTLEVAQAEFSQSVHRAIDEYVATVRPSARIH